MARREIFAGNWKMYTTRQEALALAKGIIGGLGTIGERELILFPPSVHLRELAALCAGTAVSVGAQNMYFEREGAFTGELSPAMVKDSGARHILIGHSERRHVFGETDSQVHKKVVAALAEGLEVVLCVGELLAEREAGNSERVIETQTGIALEGLSAADMRGIVIAYEPVWAIGTGKVATPEIAESMHRYIRTLISGRFGSQIAESLPLLYGGSVKPDNIAGLYGMEDIDGVLVGGASLKAQSFLDIIHVSK